MAIRDEASSGIMTAPPFTMTAMISFGSKGDKAIPHDMLL